jgi:transposase
MKSVDTIARVRREFFVRKRRIKEIARDLHISRNTVRKILRSEETAFAYEREKQPLPRIGPWQERLDAMLTAEAYVPLSFAPGEAYQFDWSHEIVLINGTTVTVKVAHVRLCHSRMLFVRAYPRETQEMVFDAHDRAFAFFRGACTRGIYDNMKTAVDAVFIGKERRFNRRFAQMCGHYLVEPVACTPASGWEKGQVENQVGLVRERFFTPRLRFKSYEELNAWLLDRCVAYAKAHRHPELRRPDGLGGVRGGAASWSLSRPVRRLPRDPGLGVEDLPGPVRQQQVLGHGERGRPPGRGPRLCRPDRDPAGWASWSASIPAASGEARRSTIPGITCLCWRASRARCAMARRSRTGLLPASLENGPPQAGRLERWRPADGHILTAVLSDGLPAVEAACAEALQPGRALRRCDPQHPGAAARAAEPRSPS